VADLREACGRHAAYVAHSENCNIHKSYFIVLAL
jgi:hypothetical protein